MDNEAERGFASFTLIHFLKSLSDSRDRDLSIEWMNERGGNFDLCCEILDYDPDWIREFINKNIDRLVRGEKELEKMRDETIISFCRSNNRRFSESFVSVRFGVSMYRVKKLTEDNGIKMYNEDNTIMSPAKGGLKGDYFSHKMILNLPPSEWTHPRMNIFGRFILGNGPKTNRKDFKERYERTVEELRRKAKEQLEGCDHRWSYNPDSASSDI